LLQKFSSKSPLAQYIMKQCREHQLTQKIMCKAPDEMEHLASTYRHYLQSTRRSKELHERYHVTWRTFSRAERQFSRLEIAGKTQMIRLKNDAHSFWSSHMAEITSRYAYLLQPVRDLAKNWDIDIIAYLAECVERYFCIKFSSQFFKKHQQISFGIVSQSLFHHQIKKFSSILQENANDENEADEKHHFNFPEAGLLIQSTSDVYSRKVEYVFELALGFSDQVRLQKGKNRNAGAQEGDDDDDAEAAFDSHPADPCDLIDFTTLRPQQAKSLQHKSDSSVPSTFPVLPLSMMRLAEFEKSSVTLYARRNNKELIGRKDDFKINTAFVHDTVSFFTTASLVLSLDISAVNVVIIISNGVIIASQNLNTLSSLSPHCEIHASCCLLLDLVNEKLLDQFDAVNADETEATMMPEHMEVDGDDNTIRNNNELAAIRPDENVQTNDGADRERGRSSAVIENDRRATGDNDVALVVETGADGTVLFTNTAQREQLKELDGDSCGQWSDGDDGDQFDDGDDISDINARVEIEEFDMIQNCGRQRIPLKEMKITSNVDQRLKKKCRERAKLGIGTTESILEYWYDCLYGKRQKKQYMKINLVKSSRSTMNFIASWIIERHKKRAKSSAAERVALRDKPDDQRGKAGRESLNLNNYEDGAFLSDDDGDGGDAFENEEEQNVEAKWAFVKKFVSRHSLRFEAGGNVNESFADGLNDDDIHAQYAFGNVYNDRRTNTNDITLAAISNEMTFDEILKCYMQKYWAASEETTSKLCQRVQKWETKLLPILEEEERRREFSIHEYGSEILNAFKDIGQTISFEELMKRKPWFECCRYLLSVLMLANTGNLSLKVENDSIDEPNGLNLTLLKRKRHHEVFDDADAMI
uniref:Kleisin, abnormal closure, protein 2 (inferred by orthology to a C. elegans protein) n=1 Tax=Anisakis simplex TaxID=6269 RepID=A0A0M3K7H1_ANISI